MIRSELVSLTTAKRLVTSDAAGFMVHKAAGVAVMPLLASVLHNGRDGEGGERELVVQEGVWYAPEMGFNLVRLATAADAGDFYVTWADRPRDVVLPR